MSSRRSILHDLTQLQHNNPSRAFQTPNYAIRPCEDVMEKIIVSTFGKDAENINMLYQKDDFLTPDQRRSEYLHYDVGSESDDRSGSEFVNDPLSHPHPKPSPTQPASNTHKLQRRTLRKTLNPNEGQPVPKGDEIKLRIFVEKIPHSNLNDSLHLPALDNESELRGIRGSHERRADDTATNPVSDNSNTQTFQHTQPNQTSQINPPNQVKVRYRFTAYRLDPVEPLSQNPHQNHSKNENNNQNPLQTLNSPPQPSTSDKNNNLNTPTPRKTHFLDDSHSFQQLQQSKLYQKLTQVTPHSKTPEKPPRQKYIQPSFHSQNTNLNHRRIGTRFSISHRPKVSNRHRRSHLQYSHNHPSTHYIHTQPSHTQHPNIQASLTRLGETTLNNPPAPTPPTKIIKPDGIRPTAPLRYRFVPRPSSSNAKLEVKLETPDNLRLNNDQKQFDNTMSALKNQNGLETSFGGNMGPGIGEKSKRPQYYIAPRKSVQVKNTLLQAQIYESLYSDSNKGFFDCNKNDHDNNNNNNISSYQKKTNSNLQNSQPYSTFTRTTPTYTQVQYAKRRHWLMLSNRNKELLMECSIGFDMELCEYISLIDGSVVEFHRDDFIDHVRYNNGLSTNNHNGLGFLEREMIVGKNEKHEKNQKPGQLSQQLPPASLISQTTVKSALDKWHGKIDDLAMLGVNQDQNLVENNSHFVSKTPKKLQFIFKSKLPGEKNTPKNQTISAPKLLKPSSQVNSTPTQQKKVLSQLEERCKLIQRRISQTVQKRSSFTGICSDKNGVNVGEEAGKDKNNDISSHCGSYSSTFDKNKPNITQFNNSIDHIDDPHSCYDNEVNYIQTRKGRRNKALERNSIEGKIVIENDFAQNIKNSDSLFPKTDLQNDTNDDEDDATEHISAINSLKISSPDDIDTLLQHMEALQQKTLSKDNKMLEKRRTTLFSHTTLSFPEQDPQSLHETDKVCNLSAVLESFDVSDNLGPKMDCRRPSPDDNHAEYDSRNESLNSPKDVSPNDQIFESIELIFNQMSAYLPDVSSSSDDDESHRSNTPFCHKTSDRDHSLGVSYDDYNESINHLNHTSQVNNLFKPDDVDIVDIVGNCYQINGNVDSNGEGEDGGDGYVDENDDNDDFNVTIHSLNALDVVCISVGSNQADCIDYQYKFNLHFSDQSSDSQTDKFDKFVPNLSSHSSSSSSTSEEAEDLTDFLQRCTRVQNRRMTAHLAVCENEFDLSTFPNVAKISPKNANNRALRLSMRSTHARKSNKFDDEDLIGDGLGDDKHNDDVVDDVDDGHIMSVDSISDVSDLTHDEFYQSFSQSREKTISQLKETQSLIDQLKMITFEHKESIRNQNILETHNLIEQLKTNMGFHKPKHGSLKVKRRQSIKDAKKRFINKEEENNVDLSDENRKNYHETSAKLDNACSKNNSKTDFPKSPTIFTHNDEFDSNYTTFTVPTLSTLSSIWFDENDNDVIKYRKLLSDSIESGNGLENGCSLCFEAFSDSNDDEHLWNRADYPISNGCVQSELWFYESSHDSDNFEDNYWYDDQSDGGSVFAPSSQNDTPPNDQDIIVQSLLSHRKSLIPVSLLPQHFNPDANAESEPGGDEKAPEELALNSEINLSPSITKPPRASMFNRPSLESHELYTILMKSLVLKKLEMEQHKKGKKQKALPIIPPDSQHDNNANTNRQNDQYSPFSNELDHLTPTTLAQMKMTIVTIAELDADDFNPLNVDPIVTNLQKITSPNKNRIIDPHSGGESGKYESHNSSNISNIGLIKTFSDSTQNAYSSPALGFEITLKNPTSSHHSHRSSGPQNCTNIDSDQNQNGLMVLPSSGVPNRRNDRADDETNTQKQLLETDDNITSENDAIFLDDIFFPSSHYHSGNTTLYHLNDEFEPKNEEIDMNTPILTTNLVNFFQTPTKFLNKSFSTKTPYNSVRKSTQFMTDVKTDIDSETSADILQNDLNRTYNSTITALYGINNHINIKNGHSESNLFGQDLNTLQFSPIAKNINLKKNQILFSSPSKNHTKSPSIINKSPHKIAACQESELFCIQEEVQTLINRYTFSTRKGVGQKCAKKKRSFSQRNSQEHSQTIDSIDFDDDNDIGIPDNKSALGNDQNDVMITETFSGGCNQGKRRPKDSQPCWVSTKKGKNQNNKNDQKHNIGLDGDSGSDIEFILPYYPLNTSISLFSDNDDDNHSIHVTYTKDSENPPHDISLQMSPTNSTHFYLNMSQLDQITSPPTPQISQLSTSFDATLLSPQLDKSTLLITPTKSSQSVLDGTILSPAFHTPHSTQENRRKRSSRRSTMFFSPQNNLSLSDIRLEMTHIDIPGDITPTIQPNAPDLMSPLRNVKIPIFSCVWFDEQDEPNRVLSDYEGNNHGGSADSTDPASFNCHKNDLSSLFATRKVMSKKEQTYFGQQGLSLATKVVLNHALDDFFLDECGFDSDGDDYQEKDQEPVLSTPQRNHPNQHTTHNYWFNSPLANNIGLINLFNSPNSQKKRTQSRKNSQTAQCGRFSPFSRQPSSQFSSPRLKKLRAGYHIKMYHHEQASKEESIHFLPEQAQLYKDVILLNLIRYKIRRYLKHKFQKNLSAE